MIEVQDLKKIYKIGFWRKSVPALRGVSFNVNEGDLFGFIGPNGAGKSTVIKILLGLLKADSGSATLMGHAAGVPMGRSQVGFLPEQPYFYDYLTGREFLTFYGRLSGLTWREMRTRVDEVSELVSMNADVLSRKLRTYSKGMLQRIGLAQALLAKPKLVILDEPMSGLDPLGRRDVRNILKGLHSNGVTVFYSSHVLSDVEAICTRMAMVIEGQIRQHGTVADVLMGEAESYHISLAKQTMEIHWPRELGSQVDAKTISCSTIENKRKVIEWALAQGLEIESVTRSRHSLEDVLAKEVAKHV